MSASPPVPKKLEVLMLGGLRLRAGDRVELHFRTQKTAALLAYLALHPGRAHRREVLMELLWPGSDEGLARRSLSTALWALRQQIRELVPGGEEPLRTDRNTVLLKETAVETDVLAFSRALRDAEMAAAPGERANHLTRAVRLYEGELLQGLYEDWVFPEQARLAALYHRALEELCTLLEASGDPAAALEFATLAVRSDPHSQEHCYRLMRLYTSCNRAGSALRHYRDFERLLERETGEAPDAALRELAREIEAGKFSEPVLPEAPPAAEEEQEAYVLRSADVGFQRALDRRSSIVLLKGPMGTGKTSLLVRGLGYARDAGMRVVTTDLRSLGGEQLATPDAFFRALADEMADQLELETLPEASWIPDWAPSLNLRRYLRRHVLRASEPQVVWVLDEVDRLFSRPFYGDVFGLFRSWHNERASDPDGLWSRMTLVLAYSTEAHLFIPDLDQSPFNVGVRLELEDLTDEQIRELNQRLGSPLREPAEFHRFVARFGGHPSLVQRALRELAQGRSSLDALERSHDAFRDHLKVLAAALRQDPELTQVVRQFLNGDPRFPEESAARLRSAGLIVSDERGVMRFRCGLYRDYLTLHLS